ncbi:MAG TPA: DUF3105 domain-containing protein [Candidatus Paceibacterota bacterium]
MKQILLWGGVGILVAGGLVALFTFTNPSGAPQAEEPTGPDYSQAMPHEGATHVAEGTEVSYQSNPPTSGSHWPIPLLDRMYDTEKPDEALVHSLEHGRIWVSYKPDVGGEVIEALKDILGNQARVILTPRAANDTDIALAAWTRLDAFDLEQLALSEVEGRILDFIARYRDKGPEYVPQMTGKTYD